MWTSDGAAGAHPPHGTLSTLTAFRERYHRARDGTRRAGGDCRFQKPFVPLAWRLKHTMEHRRIHTSIGLCAHLSGSRSGRERVHTWPHLACARRYPLHYVRHPAYAGAILYELAVPVLLASWWALIASSHSSITSPINQYGPSHCSGSGARNARSRSAVNGT